MPRTVLHNSRLPAPVGYSRAVRASGTGAIYTSMTAPVDSAGEVVGPGDAYRQAVQVLDNIRDILEENGSDLGDVVQVTAYIQRFEDCASVMRAIAERFDPPPAISAPVVSGLPNPAFLVEIAAVAWTSG
ncbi:MAG TPA: Rid family hydrolase [Streptosporangiaceae bacterium]|nr:Rid family hydrolase [Streptosporangiaceae bacterium]